ncbi:MAG: amino acid adenylation domain-containing protein, partial [Phormidium sp.]
MQATWALLLSRYSGETDVVFGATVSGRPAAIARVESMVGLFINTLPMRVQISRETKLLELLQNIQTQLVESEQYSYSSLIEIQAQSEVPRNSSLFQSILVFENYPVENVLVEDQGNFALANFQAVEQTNYPLTVVVALGERLWVKVSYDANRFDDGSISRMLGHFQTMLSAIVSNPEQPLWELPILSKTEKQQLWGERNNTHEEYQVDKCLHQWFEEQVEKTPEAVALVCEQQQLTYRELNNQANQLANYLRSMGVGAEKLVGICLERSLEMVVAIVGILKAGGAYLPLDPTYPRERISFMQEDSLVSLVLTQEKLLGGLAVSQAEIICLDRDWEKIRQQSDKNPELITSTNNLAYVIYTSGSTGKPKGVLVNHANVVRLFAATQEHYQFNAQDVWTLFHSFAFDFSVWEIWGALLYGGRLVIVPYLLAREPESFYQLLCEQQVTVLNQTPSAFRQLIAAESSLATEGELKLRLVIFGGEALDQKSLQPWYDRHGDSKPQLVNMYGITETTVHVTYRPLSQGEINNSGNAIGRPLPDLQVYILDEYLQLVPIGVKGEIYVGGAGVTRGYWNREELTAQRFIANPFEKHSQETSAKRLYKTGDLGRYLANGELEYLGRIDNQVKIRGFRIELGEIEAVLNQHQEILASVVMVREDTPGDKRLVAYIVEQTPEVLSGEQVRQYLKGLLPEFMVPSAVVFLQTLPLTANGKVDLRALPSPDFHSTHTDKYELPRTPIEEILVNLWEQILNLSPIGIHDNFFELGGHSLLATQLISRIRSQLQVEISLQSLFTEPTVAKLAQVIYQLQQQNLQLSSLPIVKRENDTDLSLSFAQTRLWFIDQFEPNSPLYNIPFALRLEGKLEVAALEQSLATIITRHEALRTNFISIDGQPTQIIHAVSNWGLSVVDLTHLSIPESEIATQQLTQQQAIQPFDLANDSLIRGTLVALSETEHILLICIHHIVSDGWSMGVFASELTILYNAYAQGQLSPLTPLPIQYADFAIWQRQWLQGEVLQTQLSYWQTQLANAPALLSLPTDRPRPAVQTFTGAHQQFVLSVDLAEKLTQLSQEQGVTLFMTLLGVFDILLYRYTEQSDIVVGTPIANRNQSEIEELIGFFANTLVLRINLSEDPSFLELLSRVLDVSLAAYTHQDLPFEMLVEALQPERNLSYSPLFQVMFVLQNTQMSQLDLRGLTISPILGEEAIAKFDLTLSMNNTHDGLVGVWEYNTDLFDGNTIERMTGHFITLVSAILANPLERISQLPMLTKVEQNQLLSEWNNTQIEYPKQKTLHQLFEEQVELTPEAIAVVFESQQLTYNELNCRANQLAHYLRSLEVDTDVLVGICLERSLEMVVGVLGILKAGGAYVPLDPEYPSERLHLMLEDSSVKVLLTQQSLLERLPATKTELVCLDREWQIISQLSQEKVNSNVQPENLAYVIYTSGSTGQPKGVAMNHLPLVNLMFWHQQNQTTSLGGKTLQFAPISFDVSCQEMFSTWSTGGTLLMITEQIRREPEALLAILQEQAVERLFLPFVGLQQLAEVATERQCVWKELREIITAGEQLQITPAISQWLSQLNDCTLHNHYGPSESHVVTAYTLNNKAENWPLLPPIGRPIPNAQIYILDAHLQPVPIGVPGELHIGGVSLARGYLNRPELTQEKFIFNPFENSVRAGLADNFGNNQTIPGQNPPLQTQNSKLYKTGDLARYLPDGNIEYLGRIDNQVKIRGYRIELGEIEALLSQHPQVQTAVVTVREDTPGDKRLVAYILSQAEAAPTIIELRQYLKAKVPEYMLPSAFVILETLPLTPSGKIDRRALPKPDSYSRQTDNYVAPRNPVEEILTHLWEQLLNLKQVGIHDNFFALGGHSLLATQLMSRIRNRLQVELPLRSLFAAPTVAQLAIQIQQIQRGNLQLSLPAIVKRENDTDLPLSYAQKRLWFIDQFEPNSSLYNIPFALRLEGKLKVTAIEQSLETIIARHEALRTNFITVDGQATQIIHPSFNWNLSVVESKQLSTTEPETAIAELVKQEANQPFDIANDLLIRAKLIVFSETEHILLVCMHHIVSDAWSMNVFVTELAELYNAYAQDQPSPLSALAIQYADFALWQREWLSGEILQTQLNYWQEQLANAPALLSLPTDRPRKAEQTFVGTHQQFTLSPELSQKLNQLSQEQGVTLFMTLLAAFKTLLYRYTGQSDILVGSPIANRNYSEIEGLIGFFVNTLVLRTDLSENPSFKQLLNRVRQVSLAAYTHQDLPFEMLVEALQPQRDLSYSPLFQVMFVLQNTPLSLVELSGLSISTLEIESAIAKFDITLSMEETERGIIGVWEYNTDLFNSSTIERMTGHLVTL